VLIIICLIIILFIIISKFPIIKTINTNSIPKEIQNKKRKAILRNRFERKIKTSNNSKKIKENIDSFFENKIKENEEQLQDNYLKKIQNDKEKSKKFIDENLEKIKKSIKIENLKDAESACFQCLKLDKNNINVLEDLAEIYIKKNEKERSIDILNFLQKKIKNNKLYNHTELKQKQIYYLLELTDVYIKDNNYKLAKKEIERAMLIDENNPRVLDKLITIYIKLEDKFMADKMLQRLIEANPENLKIDIFKGEIANIYKHK
jgi:tetratricopeptide (TPR) repeat protein